MTSSDLPAQDSKVSPGVPANLLVYVVDDQSVVRSAVRHVLEGVGARVAEFENGRTAIAASADNPPDLVLCDVFMPESDGYELIAHFRKENDRIPVIAMSGGGPMSLTDILRIGRVLGARASLMKPFSRGELLRVIGDCLGPRAGNS